MRSLRNLTRPINHMRLSCHGCRTYHDVQVPCDQPLVLQRELSIWQGKHSFPHCRVENVSIRRIIPRFYQPCGEVADRPQWWLDPEAAGLRHNTDFKMSYIAGVAFTLTSWATLASDSNLLAGASTAVVDLSAYGNALEVNISCQIKNGTTPTTAKSILVFAWSRQCDSGNTYPDAITGSDAAITITNVDARNNALRQAWAFDSTTTTGSTYPTGWHTGSRRPVANLFGGIPRYIGLWITHDTVAAFASGSTASYDGTFITGT